MSIVLKAVKVAASAIVLGGMSVAAFAPMAGAAPVQTGPSVVGQLPEWGGGWGGGCGGWNQCGPVVPQGNGCWNQCNNGPAMVLHQGPTPDAPPVWVESWKINWCWHWRNGDQGLDWYLDSWR